jgi:uncharacterized protein
LERATGVAMATEFETRSTGVAAEIRAESDGIRVVGYAAVFNQEANIGGWFREQIAPGAFDEAIGRDDVVFLINHDGLPLARSRAGKGTLTLSVDDRGLRMETLLDPEDPDVKAIVGKMQRGDLDKMSFAFIPECRNGMKAKTHLCAPSRGPACMMCRL